MRFMLIVKASKNSEAGAMPTEDEFAAMGAFNESMIKAGILLAGDGLHPSSKGARVKFRDAETAVVEGPFPETNQLVAGYWIIDVPSLEDAIAWVRRCPNPMPGTEGEIEIRRIFEAEDFGEGFTPELREQEERMREKIEAQQKR